MEPPVEIVGHDRRLGTVRKLIGEPPERAIRPTNKARHEPLVVVLDEFPSLVEAEHRHRADIARGLGRDALRRAAAALPGRADEVKLALFARDAVRDVGDAALTFTADDLYRGRAASA